jgi:hypothetical protein
MNKGRLILAGLLAGLILNIGEAVLHGLIYAESTATAMKGLGHEITGSGLDTAQLVGITFVQGLIGVLLYCAVQPRWKTGIWTAVRVGLIVWVLSAVYSGVYLSAGFAGLIPANIVWGPVVWELFLYPLAIITGALIYKEH